MLEYCFGKCITINHNNMGGLSMNKKAKNLNVEKKIKMAFNAILAVFNGALLFVFLCVLTMIVGLKKVGAPFSAGVTAAIVIVIVAIGGTALSLITIKKLASSMLIPITQIQEVVGKLKAGELDMDVVYDGKDEFGELAVNLHEACVQMNTVVKDAGFLLSEMAEGRFNVSSSAEESYIGDFNSLIISMNKLNHQLDSTLHQIADSAVKVKDGSQQMARNAQGLAEGATEQASAIEELTATIETVSQISAESANSAVHAAESAKTASENATKNREEINELTSAMERITDTSKEIENIIASIEDIASQTNMLSLNASIEAARAGEAGKGFAVVADQIGRLAADSSHSAVMTRELISKSLAEIETGNRIVVSTMEAIDSVLKDMGDFAKMASGAAEASRVQADMLKQIEAGIEQISSVVQNNSVSAQETSTVSEALAEQASNLEEMVERFDLRQE